VHVCFVVGGRATECRHEKRSRAQVEAQVHVCFVVGGQATECRHEKRSRAQVEAQVHICIVVGGRLRIVGTRSELAAQVEAQVHVCFVVGGRATDYRHEKRIGSAGRGTSACVLRCWWAGYGMQAREANWERR